MSDDEESIGEELEFNDEDSQDEFGQSFDPYSSEAQIISPITKVYRNKEADDVKPNVAPVRSSSDYSLNRSSVSVADDYSMDFSEAANETHYSEDFAAEEAATSVRMNPHSSPYKGSVQFRGTTPTHPSGPGYGNAQPQSQHQSQSQSQPYPIENNINYTSQGGHGLPMPGYGAPMPPYPPVAAPNPVSVQVPTMSIQSLQAEVAVEQLSKEVVKLRNQHRNVLRQRREVVESKKSRAEERRAKYTQELQGLRDSLTQSQAANTTLQQQVASLNAEVAQLIESRNIVQASVGRLESTISSQNASCAALQTEIEQLGKKQTEREAEWKEKGDQWSKRTEELILDAEKQKLLNDIATKSIEASEARITRERDQLPAYFQARLDEEVDRLKTLQEAVAAKEARLRVDEDNKLAQLEILRKDLLADVASSRAQLQSGIDDQKDQLETQRNEFEAARTRSESRLTAAATENDATKLLLQQQRHKIEVNRREVERQKSELAMSLAMVEPTLAKVETDKAESEELKLQAQTVHDRVTEQANELLNIERKLVERESECNRLSSELASSLEHMTTKVHQAQSEEKSLIITRKQMHNEKFALHQCMMEMHRQMDVLKMAMRQAARIIPPTQGGSAGAITVVEQEDGPVTALCGTGSEVEKQSAMRVLFTLEQSSEQLSLLIGQAVAKGSYKAPPAMQQSEFNISHLYSNSAENTKPNAENVTQRAGPGAGLGSTNMMRTYDHCSSISKKLMEMGKKQMISPSGETNALLNKYNASTGGSLNAGINAGTTGSANAPLKC